MVVRARQSFQLFRKITWFLRNNRDLSKFRQQILFNFLNQYYQIIKKNLSVKACFKLTTGATLKWMKKQLEQLHLNYFFFIDEPGCFTDMVSTMISDQY